MKKRDIPGEQHMARGVSLRRLRRIHGKEVAYIADAAMRKARRKGHKLGALIDCGSGKLRLRARCTRGGCGCAVMVAPERATADGAGFGGSAVVYRCPTNNPIGLRKEEPMADKKKREKKADVTTAATEDKPQEATPEKQKRTKKVAVAGTRVDIKEAPPFKARKVKDAAGNGNGIDTTPVSLKEAVEAAKAAKASATKRNEERKAKAKEKRHKHEIAPFKGKLPVEEKPDLEFLGKVGELFAYRKKFKSGSEWTYYFASDGKRFESVPQGERYLAEPEKAA